LVFVFVLFALLTAAIHLILEGLFSCTTALGRVPEQGVGAGYKLHHGCKHTLDGTAAELVLLQWSLGQLKKFSLAFEVRSHKAFSD
jgi:hypothetical protein